MGKKMWGVFDFWWYLTAEYWGSTYWSLPRQDLLSWWLLALWKPALLYTFHMHWDAFPLSASHFVPPHQPTCSTIFCFFVVLLPFVPDKAGRPGIWFAIWLCLDMVSLHMWEEKHCAAVWRLSTKLSSALTHHGSHIRVSLPSDLLEELATLSLRTQWEDLWGQACATSLGTCIGTGPAHRPLSEVLVHPCHHCMQTEALAFWSLQLGSSAGQSMY